MLSHRRPSEQQPSDSSQSLSHKGLDNQWAQRTGFQQSSNRLGKSSNSLRHNHGHLQHHSHHHAAYGTATSHYKDSTNDSLLMRKLLENLCAQCMAQHTRREQHNGWICRCPIHQGTGLKNPSCMCQHNETRCHKRTPWLVFQWVSMLQNSHVLHIALGNT